MAFWRFFFDTCWRQSGNIARAVQITLVSVPLMITAVINIFGGEWSQNSWPWWVWVSMSCAVIFLSIFIGMTRRAYSFERAAQTGFQLEPGNAGRWVAKSHPSADMVRTMARFGIRNRSAVKTIDDVEVMLVNVKFSNNKFWDISKRLKPHDRAVPTFTLHPGPLQIFELAHIDQLLRAKDETNPISIGPFADDSYIDLLPDEYVLKIRISGRDVATAIGFFRINVDSNGEFDFGPHRRDS